MKVSFLDGVGFLVVVALILTISLSACAPKNVVLPNVSQGKDFHRLKESIVKLYASSSKGEVYINAQRGKGYIKWDDQGATIFISKDFVPNPSLPGVDNFNKSIRIFHQEVYSRSSEGKVYIHGTEAYVQWDD
jgi:hypothetical protein